MTTMTQAPTRTGFERPSPSGLADVIDSILDKGLVIDAYVRVSLVGIELLTIDLRIVIASVDTYLRFAEATSRLDLAANRDATLPDLLEGGVESGAKSKTKGALEAAGDKVRDVFSGDDESESDSGKSKSRGKTKKG